MLNTECRYAECRYAECRYAECRYAECRGAKFKSKHTLAPWGRGLTTLEAALIYVASLPKEPRQVHLLLPTSAFLRSTLRQWKCSLSLQRKTNLNFFVLTKFHF